MFGYSTRLYSVSGLVLLGFREIVILFEI